MCFLAMIFWKINIYILCIFQISPSLMGLASDSQQMCLPIHQSLWFCVFETPENDIMDLLDNCPIWALEMKHQSYCVYTVYDCTKNICAHFAQLSSVPFNSDSARHYMLRQQIRVCWRKCSWNYCNYQKILIFFKTSLTFIF